MRGFRSTILLVVVLGGLFAYIYFVTWKKPASTDLDTKQEKVFAALQADKIDEIRVKSASGDTTTLKKTAGEWQLAAPVAARADEAIMSGITSNLASTTITRVVEDNASDLKEYGLAEPRIDVGFKAAGDKDYRHLLIGEKSPTGADLFAKRGDDKRVFLISAAQETTFNRATFDLRDKTLLRFDRDKVDGIEVAAGGKPLQMAKEGGEWKITKPLQARADFGMVEGLVSRLQALQMKSIVAAEASAADLKKYGFDKPDASVNVSLGSARATLLIGGKGDDNAVYVRDASKPAVMTVESAFADDLKKNADEYRRKDIFEFRAFNATRLEITRNGQTIVFDKVKGQGDKTPDTWRRVGPKAADADKDKIEGALAKLASLRASAFGEPAAKTGLDAPVLTVLVKFDDGKKEERVSFGKAGTDTFASRPGESGAAKIDTADFDDVVKALDEISK
jgi:Domain of unknown function (DUF4340)